MIDINYYTILTQCNVKNATLNYTRIKKTYMRFNNKMRKLSLTIFNVQILPLI